MYLKVLAFTSIFVFLCYKLNVNMLYKLEKRNARLEGKLDEFLQAEEDIKNRGFIRRNFGRFGGGEEDGIDGGITKTTLGGSW